MQEAHALASKGLLTRYRSFKGSDEVSARESIRVAVDYTNLDDESKYCTTATESKPFMGSGSLLLRPCTADSIYHPNSMGVIIKNHLMPRAQQAIESIYNVSRIESQTVVSNQCGVAVDVSGRSGVVMDVDLLIFVAAGVMPAGYDTTIAYAYPCTYDAFTGRPISAVINFNPKYLSSWSDAAFTYDNEELVQTAIHEIHHAMGFTKGNLESRSVALTVRGKEVKEVRTPMVVEKAREFFGCDSLTGLELEDEGGDGSRHAHWERRVAFEDLMVAAGGAKLSALTLAFMHDLGYYTVDFAKARQMIVGRDAGCGFIEEKCNTLAGGQSSAWYFDDAFRCSPDHKIITRSSWGSGSSAVPAQFQYDPANPYMTSPESGFTDRCPYGMRVVQSECAWEVESDANGDAIGSYPGVGSRCFETTGLSVKSSGSRVSYNARCIRTRCPFGGKRIEFRLPLGGGGWRACPLDGSAATASTPDTYEGAAICPRADLLCDEEISFGSSEREKMSEGETSLPESEGFSALTITIVLNGTQWETILSDDKRVAMTNHLRQDVAFFLKTSSRNLRIRKITPSMANVEIIFGIAELAYTADIVFPAITAVLGKVDALLYVRKTYASFGGQSALEAASISIVSYAVDEPETESICGGNISPEKCVTIIASVVFGVVLIVLIGIVYCICIRSPFAVRPRPEVARKYAVEENQVVEAGVDKM